MEGLRKEGDVLRREDCIEERGLERTKVVLRRGGSIEERGVFSRRG